VVEQTAPGALGRRRRLRRWALPSILSLKPSDLARYSATSPVASSRQATTMPKLPGPGLTRPSFPTTGLRTIWARRMHFQRVPPQAVTVLAVEMYEVGGVVVGPVFERELPYRRPRGRSCHPLALLLAPYWEVAPTARPAREYVGVILDALPVRSRGRSEGYTGCSKWLQSSEIRARAATSRQRARSRVIARVTCSGSLACTS
jgi:hypothetical protein